MAICILIIIANTQHLVSEQSIEALEGRVNNIPFTIKVQILIPYVGH